MSSAIVSKTANAAVLFNIGSSDGLDRLPFPRSLIYQRKLGPDTEPNWMNLG